MIQSKNLVLFPLCMAAVATTTAILTTPNHDDHGDTAAADATVAATLKEHAAPLKNTEDVNYANMRINIPTTMAIFGPNFTSINITVPYAYSFDNRPQATFDSNGNPSCHEPYLQPSYEHPSDGKGRCFPDCEELPATPEYCGSQPAWCRIQDENRCVSTCYATRYTPADSWMNEHCYKDDKGSWMPNAWKYFGIEALHNDDVNYGDMKMKLPNGVYSFDERPQATFDSDYKPSCPSNPYLEPSHVQPKDKKGRCFPSCEKLPADPEICETQLNWCVIAGGECKNVNDLCHFTDLMPESWVLENCHSYDYKQDSTSKAFYFFGIERLY